VANEIETLYDLWMAQRAYIIFLGQVIDSYSSFLTSHNMICSDAMYERGIKLWKKIKDLEAVLGLKE
jgi:hypothetical protein